MAVPTGVFSVALAQDATAPAEPEKMEKMVVTGSNLATQDAAATLKVETVDLSAPENIGQPTVADTLRVRATQYAGGTGVVNPGFGNGGDGSAQVSLRGLPANATLMLVNGRRTATSDLNLIPEAAIDRIEILMDGAGAIYGSDAVAGVVNVVLKDEFSGVKLGTYYANTTTTDISDWKVNALMGTTTEKSKFVASVEYSKSNEQLSVDRERSRPLGSSVSQTSNPGTFLTATKLPAGQTALRWSLVPGNTLGLTDASQIPAGFNPIASVVGGTSARNAKEAELNAALPANSPVRYGNTPSLLPGVDPGFPFGMYTLGYRPHEKYAGYFSGEHKIFDDHLVAFVNGYYAANSSQNVLAPSPLSGFVAPPTNYWYKTLFPDAAATGQPISVRYRPVEAGPRVTYTDFENIHLVAGIKGKIAESTWHWETSFLYDRTEIDDVQTGGILTDKYQELLNGTTADTAWNPFGYTPIGGKSTVNPQGMVDSITGKATSKEVDSVLGWDFKVDGEIYKLPAGALATAVGTEYRRESQDYQPDYAIQNGSVSPFNIQQPLVANRDSMAVFGELQIPIFGEDLKIPAFQKLTVSVALRYEDYSDVGDTGVKPRVSFNWQPLDEQFTIHGSWSQGFIAPSFTDLYQLPGQDFVEVYNPYTGTRSQPDEAVLTVGNSTLKPVNSESYLIGGMWDPKFLKGFSVGVDYYRIRQTGIPFSSAQFIVNQWFAYNPNNPNDPTNPYGPNAKPSGVNPLGSQVELNNQGELYQIRNVGPINSGERLTDGLDFTVSQKFNTDIGLFTLSGQATRILTFEQENFPGSGNLTYLNRYWGPGAVLDNTGFPTWRANVVLSYNYKRWTAAFAWNYTAGYIEDPSQEDFSGPDSELRSVRNYMTFDIRAGYKIPYIEADFMIGCNNLLDEQPPYVISSFENGYDRRLADIRGRTIFATLSKQF